MTWKVEIHDDARCELRKLDPQVVRRILRFVSFSALKGPSVRLNHPAGYEGAHRV